MAITPKQVIHKAIADHEDSSPRKINNQLAVSPVGIHCDCNNIVATSPFAQTAVKPEIKKALHFEPYSEIISVRLTSTIHFFFNLRGPPSV